MSVRIPARVSVPGIGTIGEKQACELVVSATVHQGRLQVVINGDLFCIVEVNAASVADALQREMRAAIAKEPT